MERYTGEENNAQIGYSESENINFWEHLSVLPEECETSQIAESYVRSVCTKLYRQKGGEYAQPDFFEKKFQIIVEDSPQIQASLTYNQYSKDGRNILRVSKGLIANVQNEAQLAFVLAHELGHFQVYETRNKDKNGINVSGHEHEMQADYLGFQSILQAGYNPDEAIKFFEMIQDTPTDVKSAFESANNEHGSTATRIANIKDYKSAAEVSGIAFSDYTGEVSYHNFQQKFMFAAQNDHYIGYLEERIRKEYNVASSQELSPHERWNFCEKIITEEPAVLSTGQRMGEFAHIFNRDVTEIKEEDIAQINRIIQKTFDYEKKLHESSGQHNMAEGKLASACISKLPEKDKNGNYYIEPFGIIDSDIKYRHDIIANVEKTTEELNWNATNINDHLRHIDSRLDKHFEYPYYYIDNLQVGDTVPWAEIASVANVSNRHDIAAILNSLGVKYDYFEHKYGDSLGYPNGMENSVYIDAQGVIISKDPEEVAKLRAESKEKVANLSIDERKRQMRLDFHDQLTMMAQYEKDSEGFKSAKQNAAKIYKESGTAFMALDNTQDYLLDNTLGFNISSQDNGHTFVKAFEKEITESYGQYYVSPINNPKYAAQFYPQYAEVILETELENIRDVYHSERYPKVEKAMASINGLYNNLLNKDANMDSVSHKVIQKMAPALFKAYGDEMGDTPGRQTVGYFHRAISQTLLNDHVGADGNLPYVEEFRQRQGIKDAHSTDDLIANLESMKPSADHIIYEDITVGYSKLLYDYEVMRTINAGVEIDVNRTLNAIPGAVSPNLADKITDYVIQKDMFAPKEGESIEQTYARCKELYITMSAKEAFTQKENMQRQFESKLLDMMQQLPPERRVAEAYDLLSTHADHNKASQRIDNSFLSGQTDKEKSRIVAENIKEIGGSIIQYDGNKQIAEKIYADHIIEKYGSDDKSATYRENMNAELDAMAADMGTSSRKHICEQVAKGVMAQKELAYDIKDIYDKDVANNTIKGKSVQGYNNIESYLRFHPEFAEKTMDFLLSDGNNADCEKFSADLAHEYNRNRSHFPQEWKDKLDNKLKDKNIKGVDSSDLQKLQIPENSFVAMVSKMHEDYRSASFEEKAVIMHRMLDYYGQSTTADQSMQKQISYVSDKVFGTREEDKDLLKEVRTISTAVCHQEEQPSLLLGAVLAGREPGQADEKMNVGDGLAMFCEKKGTAWVKLAQTLSYVDALPQDIRDSLGRLKDKANEPKQWEIYKDLEEAMPDRELARIKKVRKFIGGGTFNKTVLVDVENVQTGQLETKVVQVMHDRAATKSDREFTKINAAINELCSQDAKYEILRSVAERSAKNAKIEVDIKEGANQYRNACENYGKIDNIELNGVTYIPKVATWERYGESKFSNYKIMEMAPGKSIDSPDFSPEERREMALAYTMVELTNLMGGKAWDIDRHSKQQNFNVTTDKNGKKVVEIGIFDTGAQRPQPTNKEKELLGKFLIAIAKQQMSGADNNLGEFMLERIKKFEKAGKDVNYVSDVQRGLLAISDVMKHMNTPQNPNGMADGLKTCFKVLYQNKIIDQKLYKSLIKETAKSMLKSPKFGKAVADCLLHPSESTDRLSITLSKDDTRAEQQIKSSVQADKPAYETDKIELEKTRIQPKPKVLTPQEQVEKTLTELGVERDSYMLITKSEAQYLKTQYNDGARSIDGYFDNNEDVARTGGKILYCGNNGYTAAYFAEQDVYVVSPSCKLQNALYCKAGSKQTNLGVMFSNGECLYGDGYYTKIKQAEWDKAVQYVKQQEASKEQAKAQEVAPKQTNGGQETNKKQIVLALSGRTGQQQNYSVQSNNKTIPTQTMEAVFTQVNSAPAHEATTLAQAKSMPTNSVVTSATPKSAPTNGIAKNTVLLKNMSKEEKRNFFENLHKGVNILLTEEEHGRDAVKESCKSQTNEQTNAAVQPSILELRIAQNKDKDMS